MQSQTSHVQSQGKSIVSQAPTQRLEALRKRHGEIDKTLQMQQIRVSVPDQDLRQLKFEKLKLKDEIEYLSSVSH